MSRLRTISALVLLPSLLLLALPRGAARAEAPATAVGPDEAPSQALEEQVRARLARVDGRWSVWFRDLRTGEGFAIEPERRYDAASIMKILVMMKVLRDVEDGRYNLDTAVPVDDTFPSALPGAAAFRAEAKTPEMESRVGGPMSVRDLLHHMIVESDNLATNVLMELAGGPDAVQAHAELYGMARSRIERYLLDAPALRVGKTNRAVAAEYGQLLERIWRGEVVSPQASRTMIEIMTGLGRWWLGSRLPKRVRVAHKTGAVRGLRHDVGIFYTPDGHAWVLVVLGDRIPHTKAGLTAAHEAMADASALVWKHVRANRQPRHTVASVPDAPTLVPASWFDQAAALADRTTLAEAFAAAGYRPPRGAMVLAARVLPGVEQPAFAYYSLGDTGFDPSRGRFQPASTVKTMAAVGALLTLARHGISGAASVTLDTADGRWTGTVRTLCDHAIRRSSNPAYNRLMAIAGYDEVNHRYFTAETGYPTTAIQVAYGKVRSGESLVSSPAIPWREAGRSGTLPAREGSGLDETCGRTNCATLFELEDVVRRIALHGELPAEDRFPLAPDDIAGLAESLQRAHNRLEPGPSEALGHPVRTWNKVGYIPGRDLLEVAVIEDSVTKTRYLLAALVPFPGARDDIAPAEEELATLARHTIAALADRPADEIALQREAGLPIDLVLRGAGGDPLSYAIEVGVRGAREVEAWVGRTRLPAPQKLKMGGVRWTHRFARPGEYTLVFRARTKDGMAGYRAVTVRIPAPQ